MTTTINSGVATFDNVDILQGTYLSKQFIVDGSLDQRFILDNSFIDTSTIRVNVKTANDTGLGRPFTPSDNILNIDKNSEIIFYKKFKMRSMKFCLVTDILVKNSLTET